jgi:DNA-directed RNA polymerase specialized sigma24 family protein
VADHAEEHLRRFVAARNGGDTAAMRRWWEELVIDFHDRMDGFVAAAHRGRLDPDEHELAVQWALAKFSSNLVKTFKGTSMGELVNASKTLATFIAIDVQRAAGRISSRETLSLDSGWNDDEVGTPSWDAAEAWARHDRDLRSAEVADFLAWALPQIEASRRQVLELTFEGAPVAEIMDALGISRDNAYQLRSRGFKDLAKLKQEYDS